MYFQKYKFYSSCQKRLGNFIPVIQGADVRVKLFFLVSSYIVMGS